MAGYSTQTGLPFEVNQSIKKMIQAECLPTSVNAVNGGRLKVEGNEGGAVKGPKT